MTKGKFGLSLVAVAVIAFAFAVLRQPMLVLLVCGFALLAEKDEWLNRQAIQALFLTIAYYLVDLVLDWIFGGLARFFGWVKLYGVVSAMSTVGSILNDILYLALIVFSVIAILRVVRGKDADLPFISKMAGGDFSAVTKSKVGLRLHQCRQFPLCRLRRIKRNTRLQYNQLIPFKLLKRRRLPLLQPRRPQL